MAFSKRITFKLSKDLTEEQIHHAIAEVMNMPVEQVSHINIRERLAKLNDERQTIETVIHDYKTNAERHGPLPKYKLEELYDVGRFILKINPEIKIDAGDENLKFPDFILRYQDKRIALEHTRLLSADQQQKFKTAKYIVEHAEQVVRDKINGWAKTINIFLKADVDFKAANIQLMVDELASYLIALLNHDVARVPAFVSRVSVVNNPDGRLDLVLAETYFTNDEISEALLTRIAAKEKKAGNYRRAGDFEALWLLVTIDDINSPSGYFLQEFTVPEISTSGFDAIFLFEKYNGRWILIYPRF
jgi:hypothetical protein